MNLCGEGEVEQRKKREEARNTSTTVLGQVIP